MNHPLNRRVAPLAAIFLLGLISACGEPGRPDASDTDHGETAAEDYARGPNNGRLLEDGAFALEMTIFETGVPPQYRIYPYKDGTPLDPSSVDLTVKLHRLGGIVDTFQFVSRQDYLMGDGVVTEPHSFEVEVTANFEGKTHSWRYESFEGRTTIPEDVAAEAGVGIETAGPGIVRDLLLLSGEVSLAPSATSAVRATYPGPVRSVSVNVGDRVQRGQPLARIESSSSLQEYTVTAPKNGTILERNTNAGDVAGADPLFVIADLSQMEAYLHVFPRDAARVKAGQTVRLGVAGDEMMTETSISRFLPMAGANSQTRIAVAGIPADSGLQPGMRLMAEVVIAENEVPLTVREAGLQSFRDFTVVYAKVGDTYEVRMLELGRRDGERVEVLAGLRPGEIYVTDNSFLIKADIEKSGASHDH
ncbi:MAG: HlyD family secretion protein [Alphaproteobacteria bacterium HGW-Alphaproteobacteria-18]|nr:MAG: HlyD family secretion protein [Alphaproteobacteria bacterium HGW-Alphaproteobacteria-18]